MRRDFVLPVLLSTALVGLTIYARTGANTAPALPLEPVACEVTSAGAMLADLPEASGLAASATTTGLFWSHNDSAEPYIFALTADGTTRGRTRVAGASLKDWEAVTTGACDGKSCVFVGDIGDNDSARRSIVVYRVPEPEAGARATEPSIAIEGVYPEGPQDAEAIFVSDGRLYLVTKGEGTPIRLYRFPTLEPHQRQTLELVTTLTAGSPERRFRVTDAAVSPNGRWVAMRTNDMLLFFARDALLAGRPAPALSFDVRPLKEPQGEGIAWSGPQSLLLAGEGEGAGTLAHLSCNLPG
jgi:hypothetical protein